MKEKKETEGGENTGEVKQGIKGNQKNTLTEESNIWRTDPQTRRDNLKEKLSCSDLKILQTMRTPGGE